MVHSVEIIENLKVLWYIILFPMKRFLVLFVFIFFTSCLFRKGRMEEFSPERSFELGLYYFYKGKYDKAREYFNKVLFSGEITEMTDDAQFYIAKSYLNQKEYETALSEYNFLINQFPNSEHREEADFDILKIYILKIRSPLHETEELEVALSKIKNFIEKYPESRFKEEVKAMKNEILNLLAEKIYKIAELYEKMGRFESAEIYYRELLEKYPDTIWAERAKKKIGEK